MLLEDRRRDCSRACCGDGHIRSEVGKGAIGRLESSDLNTEYGERSTLRGCQYAVSVKPELSQVKGPYYNSSSEVLVRLCAI